MKQFINDYRKFRQLARDEIGDIRENDLLRLFSLFIEQQQPVVVNPLGGLESFFQGISPFFNPSSINPDDDENDDDPFSANSSGA
jgi:hypothetical protein